MVVFDMVTDFCYLFTIVPYLQRNEWSLCGGIRTGRRVPSPPLLFFIHTEFAEPADKNLIFR